MAIWFGGIKKGASKLQIEHARNLSHCPVSARYIFLAQHEQYFALRLPVWGLHCHFFSQPHQSVLSAYQVMSAERLKFFCGISAMSEYTAFICNKSRTAYLFINRGIINVQHLDYLRDLKILKPTKHGCNLLRGFFGGKPFKPDKGRNPRSTLSLLS